MDDKPETNDKQAHLDAENLVQTAEFIATAIASGAIGLYVQRIHDWLLAQMRLRGRGDAERLRNELEQEVFQALKRVKRDPEVSDEDLELRVREVLRKADLG